MSDKRYDPTIDQEVADLIYSTLVGLHNGDRAAKPNNPAAHALFKTIINSKLGKDINDRNDVISRNEFAFILYYCGKALIKGHPEAEVISRSKGEA